MQLMELLRETKDLLQTVLKPHGFNVGMNLGRIAGAGIPGHLHVHIVPRWKGDHNFMPVTAATKVISQSLSVIYKKLDDAYKEDIEDLESKTLAPYAMKSQDAGARQFDEPVHEWRTCISVTATVLCIPKLSASLSIKPRYSSSLKAIIIVHV